MNIIYTITDEAPRLATESLLPIVRSFAGIAGVKVETRDISLAGRILAAFKFRQNDLSFLGELTKDPNANIIKLPNISASVPQMKAAIAELQQKGFLIPDYPENPQNENEKNILAIFDKIKGSAVNPVLREGNSDRRAPLSVKNYAKKNPHKMAEWKPENKTRVEYMQSGDFYESEKSITLEEATSFSIQFVGENGTAKELKKSAPLLAGEILDATVLSIKKLENFFDTKFQEAKKENMSLSVHLKATMMKVSDPVIFGCALRSLLKPVFEKYAKEFDNLSVNANNGLGDLRAKIEKSEKKEEIEREIESAIKNAPKLSMSFNSPNDVIIDASMPVIIKNAQENEVALIPDRSYAKVYEAAIDFCKTNGAFDPTTMGSMQNVGLMAQAAEEYGSHDKTFIANAKGIIRAIDGSGNVLLEQNVEEGDIFRMCQTKDTPVRDWVRLALKRAKMENTPVVFWLDENRAHDNKVKKKVEEEIIKSEIFGADVSIKNPVDAVKFSMSRLKEGKDIISATGNVLRDYLTDLFPILELGTSAKLLSIVPLFAGGGVFETGAGGSAPKHVEQLLKENYLRWDSLGEYLALAESLAHYSRVTGNEKASILARTLNNANENILKNNRTPERKLGGLDNRGSHFYFALYWAQELASENSELSKIFEPIAKKLTENEKNIVAELASVQGKPADIGGYYLPDEKKIADVMRPCTLFNEIIANAD